MRFGAYGRNPVAWIFVIALVLAVVFGYFYGEGLVFVWLLVAFVAGILLLDEGFSFRSKHTGDDDVRKDQEPRFGQVPLD